MSSDFKAAADWLSTSPAAAQLADKVKLEIYGLFKYVTTGAGPTSSRPGIWSIAARAKHDAWEAASKASLETSEERYIQIAQELGWKGEKGRGVRVSTLAGDQDEPLADLEDKVQDEGYLTSRDDNGYTPLHIAADRGLLDAARLLLSRGADHSLKASLPVASLMIGRR